MPVFLSHPTSNSSGIPPTVPATYTQGIAPSRHIHCCSPAQAAPISGLTRCDCFLNGPPAHFNISVGSCHSCAQGPSRAPVLPEQVKALYLSRTRASPSLSHSAPGMRLCVLLRLTLGTPASGFALVSSVVCLPHLPQVFASISSPLFSQVHVS